MSQHGEIPISSNTHQTQEAGSAQEETYGFKMKLLASALRLGTNMGTVKTLVFGSWGLQVWV
jgi:hypothetical protein